MNDDQPQEPPDHKVASEQTHRWLPWVFLGLAPIPIGLLMGPGNIFNSLQSNHEGPLVFYSLITIVCSVLCGVGQSGGLVSRKVSTILGGVFAGVLIAIFNVSVVLFAGCCSAFSHI